LSRIPGTDDGLPGIRHGLTRPNGRNRHLPARPLRLPLSILSLGHLSRAALTLGCLSRPELTMFRLLTRGRCGTPSGGIRVDRPTRSGRGGRLSARTPGSRPRDGTPSLVVRLSRGETISPGGRGVSPWNGGLPMRRRHVSVGVALAGRIRPRKSGVRERRLPRRRWRGMRNRLPMHRHRGVRDRLSMRRRHARLRPTLHGCGGRNVRSRLSLRGCGGRSARPGCTRLALRGREALAPAGGC
jgi:hypothetical protein